MFGGAALFPSVRGCAQAFVGRRVKGGRGTGTPAAVTGGGEGGQTTDAERAASRLAGFRARLREGKLGAALAYLPDDDAEVMQWEQDEAPHVPRFADQDGADVARVARRMDACAQRVLLFDDEDTEEPRVLSSVSLGGAGFAQRVAHVGQQGERAVLTYRAELEERLTTAYKGGGIAEEWVVREVRGEAEDDAESESPDPRHTPDDDRSVR